MTKRPTESRDWSRGSESLFHSARADYAATEADRERVRSALAQRLTETAGMLSAGGDVLSAGAGVTAVGKLVKIGIGVAVMLAGAVAFMRAGDGEPPEVPPKATIPSAPTAAPPEVGIARPAELPEHAASHSNEAPVAKRRSAPAARDVARRARERTAISELAAPGPAATLAPSEPPIVEERPRVQPKLPAAEPAQAAASARPTENSKASGAPAASASTGVRDPAPEPVVQAAPEETSSEVRAELAWMAKIDAAMRKSKLSTVLALCAEHARRWPQGLFVQEREALGTIAACRSGARDAEARAARFFRSYPRAPLAPRVEQACAPRTQKDTNVAR